MNEIQKHLLEEISDLQGVPQGAYNIRSNSQSVGRASTAHIKIATKPDQDGLDIFIQPGTRNESVHIPVIISQAGLKELIYNDYYIGEGADVVIVGGCGIHCGSDDGAVHDSIHTFHVGKNASVKYIEKHYGEGDGKGERIMNPTTIVEMQEGSFMDMETSQIKGIDSTERITKAKLAARATFIVKEKIMTHDKQYAKSYFMVELNGEDSKTNVVSRSVGSDASQQIFLAKLFGNNRCYGHSECDSIIMDDAKISAIPEITAQHLDANLIHEAAIGKIAGEQLAKLMTLGLTAREAEEQIIQGFLR